MKRSPKRSIPACSYCHNPVNPSDMWVCLDTPEGREELPSGSGWVVCKPTCSGLPPNADVLYRQAGR